VVSKEVGLEVNAHKTKYMVMSRDQHAGRSQSMKTDNSSFQSAEEFKYLGKTLTNQNSIHEEIKSGLMSGNVCNHSVQNLLCFRFLSKNLKINIHGTIICLLFCMGVKLGRSH
jgi:predicted transcriptional regulator